MNCLKIYGNLFRGGTPVGGGRKDGAGETSGNLFCWRSVCQVSLDKNHSGWKGTTGIHRAILMNCTAQAGLNSASEAEFSLSIRCGFYQVRLRRSLCLKKRFPEVSPAPSFLPPPTGWVHPADILNSWGDFVGGSGLHWQTGSSSPHYIVILAAMLVSIQFCSTTYPGGHSTKQITIYLSL